MRGERYGWIGSQRRVFPKGMGEEGTLQRPNPKLGIMLSEDNVDGELLSERKDYGSEGEKVTGMF